VEGAGPGNEAGTCMYMYVSSFHCYILFLPYQNHSYVLSMAARLQGNQLHDEGKV
jgi:hypothetical protein